MKKNYSWIVWGCVSLVLAALLGSGLTFKKLPENSFQAQMRNLFSPAKLSAGHAQIGVQCTACHGDKPNIGKDAMQEACTGCHPREAGNKAADTHPASKFEDPANAKRLENLDALHCVTCHGEHQPGAVHKNGVTLPKDFCMACHKTVAKDAPSHRNLAFDTCTNTGCHSFHDNRSTYTNFLVKHAGEKDPEPATVLARNFGVWAKEQAMTNPHGKEIYAGTKPCTECHEAEKKSFGEGKHGMRIAAGLSPMSPAQSSLAFKANASHKELTCTTCHEAKRPDLRKAAVEACMTCHNDLHTLAYRGSPHELALQKELKGEAPQGSGVSCATCHMPRFDSGERIVVSHNQSMNMRPVVKQAKTVCLACHTLQFSLDSLADQALLDNNFSGKPQIHVKSIDMALQRKADKSRKEGENMKP